MNVLKIAHMRGLAFKEGGKMGGGKGNGANAKRFGSFVVGFSPHPHEKNVRSGKKREGANRNRDMKVIA